MNNEILNIINECFEFTISNKNMNLFNTSNYILKELEREPDIDIINTSWC